MIEYSVYTDGSSLDSQYGGYACLFLETGEMISGRGLATNQLAEMLAIELALQFAPNNCRLLIHTDSAFCINAISKRWNLSNSKHLQIVRQRIDLLSISKSISYKFVKVQGHSSDRFNRLCDRQAGIESSLLRSEMQ